jgi:glycosyltransferase involved in cell wall biosynthesis
MMKIAFINQPWSLAAPTRGGDSIGIWIYQIARRLASKAEISVYGAKSGDKSDYITEGIRYRGITSKIDKTLLSLRILDRWGISNPKRPIYASTLYYRNYIAKIARELSTQHVDIIHIHNFSSFAPIVRRFNPKAKIIIHSHCSWLSELDRNLIDRYIKNADLIIGCSEYTTSETRRCFPHLADRTQTVFNGVDTNHFVANKTDNNSRDGDKPKILYVGRISPEKGIHDLIDAFQEVLKQYPQATLDLVGQEAIVSPEFLVRISDDPMVKKLASFYPGSYLDKIKSRIPLAYSDRINFVGGIDQEKILKYYTEADILVNPSLSESFGMSLVEAMACKVPVIATRVGGMTSVIEEGKTGLLVEPANPSALAKGIIDLLGNSADRRQMGVEGDRRVNTLFSWDKISEDLFTLYLKLQGLGTRD